MFLIIQSHLCDLWFCFIHVLGYSNFTYSRSTEIPLTRWHRLRSLIKIVIFGTTSEYAKKGRASAGLWFSSRSWRSKGSRNRVLAKCVAANPQVPDCLRISCQVNKRKDRSRLIMRDTITFSSINKITMNCTNFFPFPVYPKVLGDRFRDTSRSDWITRRPMRQKNLGRLALPMSSQLEAQTSRATLDFSRLRRSVHLLESYNMAEEISIAEVFEATS